MTDNIVGAELTMSLDEAKILVMRPGLIIPVTVDTSTTPRTYHTTVSAETIMAHKFDHLAVEFGDLVMAYDGCVNSGPDAAYFYFSTRGINTSTKVESISYMVLVVNTYLDRVTITYGVYSNQLS